MICCTELPFLQQIKSHVRVIQQRKDGTSCQLFRTQPAVKVSRWPESIGRLHAIYAVATSVLCNGIQVYH